MADHDIQNSRHLLKRLEEEIDFLSDILDQAKSILDQSRFVISNLKVTQTEIRYSLHKVHAKEI
jgi:RNase adaptor protein for sRNA GlmZ degradation